MTNSLLVVLVKFFPENLQQKWEIKYGIADIKTMQAANNSIWK